MCRTPSPASTKHPHQKSIVEDVILSPDLIVTISRCLFQTSFFLGGDFSPTPKKLTISSQTVAKLCALNLFGRDNELHIYHENTLLTLLMDNKQRKLFVTKQSK